MKEDIRSLIIGIIAGLVVSVLISTFRYFDFIYITNTITAFLWVFIPFLFGMVYLAVAHHVRKQQEQNLSRFLAIKHSPNNIMDIYKDYHFGVYWEAKIGTYGPGVFSINQKPYALAEGPYCPKCGYELDEYKKLSFFGWKDKYYWRCEPCDKLYRRPDKTLFREDKVVEKIAMKEFREKSKGT